MATRFGYRGEGATATSDSRGAYHDVGYDENPHGKDQTESHDSILGNDQTSSSTAG